MKGINRENKKIKEKEGKEMKGLISLLLAVVVSTVSVSAMDRDELRDELDVSIDGERMQELSVREIKLGEYQDGKTLTDIHGNRVRLEQYILVPEPNQIEFLSYTKREGSVDTLRGLYTLSADIPTVKIGEEDVPDVRLVGELDPVKWEAGELASLEEPDYYVTDVECSASNDKGDSVKMIGTGGELYIKKAIIDNTDAEATDYKYDVVYDESLINVNDVTKVRAVHNGGIAGTIDLGTIDFYLPDANSDLSNVLTINPAFAEGEIGRLVAISDAPTLLGTTVVTEWDGKNLADFDLGDLLTLGNKKLDWKNTITFADGTFLEHRQAWLKDDGEILTLRKLVYLISGLRPHNWAARLSSLNHEGIWKATEFNDQENGIDVIWSPSIFVKVATSDMSE